MGLKGYRLWAMGQLDSTCSAPSRSRVSDGLRVFVVHPTSFRGCRSVRLGYVDNAGGHQLMHAGLSLLGGVRFVTWTMLGVINGCFDHKRANPTSRVVKVWDTRWGSARWNQVDP